MKKMKVWSTVLATGVSLTTLAACSGGSNSTTASSSEEKADKSQELVIYSNSVSNGRGDWLTAKAKEAGFNIKMVDIAG
ncbi:TPA: iron ABC transporter substrate-binding protein, partial [Streptococcus pneumoniae]|nr:iron ABC transporter substrate-binding protein [Streptococcus pneumoniae]